MGIEPMTFSMQTKRCTTQLAPLLIVHKIYMNVKDSHKRLRNFPIRESNPGRPRTSFAMKGGYTNHCTNWEFSCSGTNGYVGFKGQSIANILHYRRNGSFEPF